MLKYILFLKVANPCFQNKFSFLIMKLNFCLYLFFFVIIFCTDFAVSAYKLCLQTNYAYNKVNLYTIKFFAKLINREDFEIQKKNSKPISSVVDSRLENCNLY